MAITLTPIRRPISHVVIHTAGAAAMRNGAPVPVDQSAATIRNYHIRHNGWRDIGYHFVVRMGGAIELGRNIEHTGAHVEDFNGLTVGICFTGHGDIQAFTTDQMREGVQLVAEVLRAAKISDKFLANPMRVLGHRECYALPGVKDTGKTCPGTKIDMKAFRLAVLSEVSRQ